MAALRAKIRIGSVLDQTHGTTPEQQEKYAERVIAHAVYSDDPGSENKQWSQWTPSFHLDMTINNPNAFGKVKVGDEFYLDFIPAEKAEANQG